MGLIGLGETLRRESISEAQSAVLLAGSRQGSGPKLAGRSPDPSPAAHHPEGQQVVLIVQRHRLCSPGRAGVRGASPWRTGSSEH